MVCKGICTRYKATRIGMASRYELGQKRYTNCQIFMNWDGKYCPCCNYVLRTRPRGTLGRRRMLLVAKRN